MSSKSIIPIQTHHRVFLKEGGEKDAYLRMVILAGLSTLGIDVPPNANVGIIPAGNGDGGMGVSVNWHEEEPPHA